MNPSDRVLNKIIQSLKTLKPEQALPDRTEAIVPQSPHAVLGTALMPPYPEHDQRIVLALGCFWGAERLFWEQPGVYVTAVGYVGGITANPTYKDVCSGLTGHTEGVLVVFDPEQITLQTLLELFWEAHDPTQGMRQGNDIGTQYRSAIYFTNSAQEALVRDSLQHYQRRLRECSAVAEKAPLITTELAPLGDFYFAEEYHQQYLSKNPNGYCGLAGTGVDYLP